jgi:hypothetical protein
MTCLLCEDTGWVCENHPDQPFTGPHELWRRWRTVPGLQSADAGQTAATAEGI